MWEFPGGKVDNGESTEAGIARELREELGIKVDMRRLFPATFVTKTHFGRPLLMVLFVCPKYSGMVTSKECQSFRWVSTEELAKGNIQYPNGDERFAEWLLAHTDDAGSLSAWLQAQPQAPLPSMRNVELRATREGWADTDNAAPAPDGAAEASGSARGLASEAVADDGGLAAAAHMCAESAAEAAVSEGGAAGSGASSAGEDGEGAGTAAQGNGDGWASGTREAVQDVLQRLKKS
jgi:mutator protein MutT